MQSCFFEQGEGLEFGVWSLELSVGCRKRLGNAYLHSKNRISRMGDNIGIESLSVQRTKEDYECWCSNSPDLNTVLPQCLSLPNEQNR